MFSECVRAPLCLQSCVSHARRAFLVAFSTGLRVSELLGLRWENAHFDVMEIIPTRAIVDQVIGPLKTDASGKPVPMDNRLPRVLLDWRGRCSYNQDGVSHLRQSGEARKATVLARQLDEERRASGRRECGETSPRTSAGFPFGGLWQRCSKRTVKRSKRRKTCCVIPPAV